MTQEQIVSLPTKTLRAIINSTVAHRVAADYHSAGNSVFSDDAKRLRALRSQQRQWALDELSRRNRGANR